jgi:hypothetical protein
MLVNGLTRTEKCGFLTSPPVKNALKDKKRTFCSLSLVKTNNVTIKTVILYYHPFELFYIKDLKVFKSLTCIHPLIFLLLTLWDYSQF